MTTELTRYSTAMEAEALRRVYVDVPVPELNTLVTIRSLTEAERAEYEVALYVGPESERAARHLTTKSRLFAASVVDHESKTPLYRSDPDTLEKIGRFNAALTQRVYDAALNIGGLREPELRDKLEKNESSAA